MPIKKVEWRGSMAGSVLIWYTEAEVIRNIDEMNFFIRDWDNKDDLRQLAGGDMQFLGCASLVLAIRGVLPYLKKYVLDWAVHKMGGAGGPMLGNYFSLAVLFGAPYYNSDYYEGGEALAKYLNPIQTESQYALKCNAYAYMRRHYSDYLK